MKEKIVGIRGAFDDIVDSWCLKRIIPDEALDSLKNASKKLGEILPKVELGMQKGMQDLEKKFSKALDEYTGELAHVGITSVPNKIRADQLKAPKGNELKGAKSSKKEFNLSKLKVSDIPTFDSGNFNKWFDSRTPEELANRYKNPALKNKISDGLRGARGNHEFLMVVEAPKTALFNNLKWISNQPVAL
ncbi:hypothetical protein KO495_13685 [Colwellia sp. D2M02]|uniref:hypothetical protein n=1 Tax=Colwellia sp. D2M02 TaxID=2841562 RepID=UPI001C0973A3|nr:hypothetical protein [Colwellia sp. D2M02]MBU2894361.1 hypothetical protein [Colwellia sp. D2M02]